MRSTERPVRLWSHLLGVVVALDLSMSAHAAMPADSPALNRPTCLANGNWYGFYHGNQGLKAVCLKLPEAISVKMLDSNADARGATYIQEMCAKYPEFLGTLQEGYESKVTSQMEALKTALP